MPACFLTHDLGRSSMTRPLKCPLTTSRLHVSRVPDRENRGVNLLVRKVLDRHALLEPLVETLHSSRASIVSVALNYNYIDTEVPSKR